MTFYFAVTLGASLPQSLETIRPEIITRTAFAFGLFLLALSYLYARRLLLTRLPRVASGRVTKCSGHILEKTLGTLFEKPAIGLEIEYEYEVKGHLYHGAGLERIAMGDEEDGPDVRYMVKERMLNPDMKVYYFRWFPSISSSDFSAIRVDRYIAKWILVLAAVYWMGTGIYVIYRKCFANVGTQYHSQKAAGMENKTPASHP